jgi:hypothetical protein
MRPSVHVVPLCRKRPVTCTYLLPAPALELAEQMKSMVFTTVSGLRRTIPPIGFSWKLTSLKHHTFSCSFFQGNMDEPVPATSATPSDVGVTRRRRGPLCCSACHRPLGTHGRHPLVLEQRHKCPKCQRLFCDDCKGNSDAGAHGVCALDGLLASVVHTISVAVDGKPQDSRRFNRL